MWLFDSGSMCQASDVENAHNVQELAVDGVEDESNFTRTKAELVEGWGLSLTYLGVDCGWSENDELLGRKWVMLTCCTFALHFISRSVKPCMMQLRLMENLVLLSKFGSLLCSTLLACWM